MKIKIIILALILGGVATAHAVTPKENPVQLVIVDTRAQKIDDYFKKRNMPLAGYGKKFVEEADKNNIDWRLMAALSVREQSGGKRLPYNCPGKTKNYNAWGWGSGSICFKSFDEGIEVVSLKLGTHRYYKGKSTYGKLITYNPPSVVKNYAYEVIAIMNAIAPDEK